MGTSRSVGTTSTQPGYPPTTRARCVPTPHTRRTVAAQSRPSDRKKITLPFTGGWSVNLPTLSSWGPWGTPRLCWIGSNWIQLLDRLQIDGSELEIGPATRLRRPGGSADGMGSKAGRCDTTRAFGALRRLED
eukprot:4113972-Pyramimonas_sp.AAC.1